MKPLPPASLDHYCRLHEQAVIDPTRPIDVSDVNSSCIRAMFNRGLIEYEYITVNNEKTRRILFTDLGLKYACELMALVPDGTVSQRKRLWVKMQFDVNNPDYANAYRIAGELAEQRLLAETVADLLRIHDAAETGDYRLFYELYGIPETQETRQFESMLQTFGNMQSSLDTLLAENRMLREQLQNTPQSRPMVANFDFDDNEETLVMNVVKDENAGKNASINFLRSVMALNPQPEPAPSGIRTITAQTFDVPDYDDDEDLFG